MFYDALAKDKTLQKKFKLAGEKYEGQKPDEAQMDLIYQNDVIPFAKASGFDFTIDELKNYSKEIGKSRNSELTDRELAAVAGGVACVCVAIGFGVKGSYEYCACVAFGGGQGEGYYDFCFCLAGGGGNLP